MKKIITLVAVMALALCACFAVACGGNEAVGTWKFESNKTVVGGQVVSEINIGDEGPDGEALTADYMVLVINDDGTVSSTSTMEDEAMTGTWQEVDGKIAITIEGETQNFEIKDGKLVMEMTETYDGVEMTITLTLAKA